MINFDSLTLKIFYEDNKLFFEGAKIQKIQQPSKFELIFFIRVKGETKKFYINFSPNFAHLCFMDEKTEKLRRIQIPKTAPMFCMLLRKYIQNAKILRVEVPEYERIFEIYFEYFNELNEKSQLCLAIELMGKYSNIILYNYDTNVIIGCAHNVSSQKSRERELYGMLPYVYPAKQRKKNLLKTDFAAFQNEVDFNNLIQSISSKFYYLTSSLVEDCINIINPFELKKLYNKLVSILEMEKQNPCISMDYSKYYISKFPNTFNCKNINEMIDIYFSYHQEKFLIEQIKSKINKYVNNNLNRLKLLKEKQEIQIKKYDEACEYKKKADIINANIYQLKTGDKSVKLYDFEGNETVINLDENKTPSENAQKYYHLYKKAKTAYEYALNMIKETNSEILYFEEMKYYTSNLVSQPCSSCSIASLPVVSAHKPLFKVTTPKFSDKERERNLLGQNSSNILDELENIYSELVEQKETTDTNTTCEVNFIEFEGFKIYAGKNKKQNDYLLSKLSTSEDLWFHPLNAPGAHVIVKTNKKSVPKSVILKAAQITKEYSQQKNNSKISIIWTKRKYVKKATKKQAFVTYKNETEVVV